MISNPVALWRRLNLLPRVMLAAVLAAAIATGGALALSARFVAQTAQDEIESRFQAEMAGLVLAVSASLEARHYDQIVTVLDEYLARPGVHRVGFRDVSEVMDLNNETRVPQSAPDWFVAWCNATERQGSEPVMVRGEYYGVLSLTLSPTLVVNRAWERLTEQILVLVTALAIGLFGVWLVLRAGLRPLDALASLSRALGAGDFSRRLRPQGSPEFISTIEAFNKMADNIGNLLSEVRLREENLGVTLSSIGDAVLVTDTDGRITLMNPVAEELTGWPLAEAIGQPAVEVFRIINEMTRSSVESPIDIVLREGRVVGLANHTLLIARDGTERPIADSGAPIRLSEAGELRGVVLVFRDQTEEHARLKALQVSERMYASLAAEMPAGITRFDTQLRAVYTNETVLRMFGVSDGNELVSAWGKLMHPDDRDEMLATWEVFLQTHAECQMTYRIFRPNGDLRWLNGRMRVIRDEAGNIDGYLSVVFDITEERQRSIRIEHLSRLYEVLSRINSAIVHVGDESSLFRQVCEIAVNDGGFSLAWIGLADYASERVELVAQCGAADVDELSRLIGQLSLDPSAPETLSTMALFSRKRAVSEDFAADDRLPLSLRNGLRSICDSKAVCAVPLLRFGDAVAVLMVASAEMEFFDEETLSLVDEIAQDISFALENFERRSQRRQIEQQLERNEERLRLSLSISGMGMFEGDLDHNTVRLDAVAARLTGLGESGIVLDVEDYLTRTFGEGSLEMGRQLVDDLRQRRRTTFSIERPLRLPDGRLRWVHSQGGVSVERNDRGESGACFYGVLADVTREREQAESERLTMAMFKTSREAIMIADAEVRLVMVNPAFTEVTGYAAEEVLGRNPALLKSERQDRAFYEALWQSVLTSGHWQGEVWNRHRNGTFYPALLSVSAVRDEQGQLTHYIGQLADISRQKEFEERISYLAYRDSLTDLPNRTLLRDRVEQGLAAALREGFPVALLFLDLDHFKTINDSLGHLAGDSLLREVARRLRAAVREMDTVGRLGGDEFLLMLPATDAEDAAHVAQKLIDEVVRPMHVDSHNLTVTPSIGIAMFPKDGTTYDELLKTADTAMYRAKDEGRNAYRFFTPEMNQVVFQRLVLESNLRRAIGAGEFVLFYQPQFDVASGRLIGAEALLRWRQEELGYVSPGQFIPVAEESGLIEAIGAWVLGDVCRQLQLWQADKLPLPRIGVNFSSRQFAAKNVVQLVDQVLAQSGLPGTLLEVEITESLLATDLDYTLGALRELKQRGLNVAVDDFGTGYSSLSYLKRFPIDRLKIDQSFVRDLETDADDRAIASAVVRLGHSLGMKVIAEGVETDRQLKLLQEMGCNEVQGYLLGRPMPASEFTALLRQDIQR